ncbi:hypothetical protein GCM10020258_26110 [Sphingomonas yabuuchiae]
MLLNYPLDDSAWDRAFLDGLAAVLNHFDARLIGGDTVTLRGPRSLTLTAFGRDAAAPPAMAPRRGTRCGSRARSAMPVWGW